MDVDLALVSALQLRELLQQHSPLSPQVQDLASECKKLFALGEESLKGVSPSDPRLQKACKELEEALTFFHSIAAADEDLAKQQGADEKQNHEHHQHESAASGRHRHGRRAERENSKRQHRGRNSSSKGKKKDKLKAAEAERTAPDAPEKPVDSLFGNWPPIDFTFPESQIVVPTGSTGLEVPSWGNGAAKDPFRLSAADSCAAAAAPANAPAGAAEESARLRRGRARTHNRRRAKTSSTSRPCEADASSSDGDSSSSSSSSRSVCLSSTAETHRENSNESEVTKSNDKRRRRQRRINRSLIQPCSDEEITASAAFHPAGTPEVSADDCCRICVSSLRAVFVANCAASPFRIDASIFVPSESLETEAENTSELGVVVSSSSSGDTSRELQVTWQQPLHFLIRTRQAEGGRKRGEGGSASANPLQYLQKEGILRFIIRRGDDAWPAFSAQFPLSSLTYGVFSTHHVSMFSKEENATDYNAACGYLTFSLSAEPAKPSAGATPLALADLARSTVSTTAEKKTQRRADTVGAHGIDLHASLNSARNENASLQQQNKLLQAQVEEQQQALMQQQQHILALEAHMQQLTAQLTEASQRLAAAEMQQQQQQQTLQRMQQQRDSESRGSAAEIARLQHEVQKLEDLRRNAEEEQKLHRKQIRSYRTEAEQQERELRRLLEEQKDAHKKAVEQEKTIVELRTLLSNARSRIRNERQRNEGLVGKLEAACEVESSLKAELQASQKAAEEGKLQLLSLTWGLEAPPVFTGFPESAPICDKQPGKELRRKQQQKGDRGEADEETTRDRLHSDTHGVDTPTQSLSRACADPTSSVYAQPRRWNDTRILRRLLPPSQPTGAVWETALRLPMQEGYSHILLEHGIPSGQPWGGVLLESTELTVEWFCSVHSGSGGKGSSLLPAFLSGSIAATASFIANICFNLAPCPDVTVALDREVLEGGRVVVNAKPNQGARCVAVAGKLEVSRPSRDIPTLLISALTPDSQKRSLRLKLPLPSAVFCVPFPLSREAFSTRWRSLEMQEEAVLIDMVPNRIRMALSLCALGGRFLILPMDEGDPRGEFSAGAAGCMRIQASGAFPASAECLEGRSVPHFCPPSYTGHPVEVEKYIPCLVELSVKRNAFAGTERQMQSASKWGRTPSGLLRVRCANSSLRNSVLEVLLQQFLTPSQIIHASPSA